MLLGLGAFSDWVFRSEYNGETGTTDNYWYNNATGETSLTPPAPDVVSPVAVPAQAPQYFVWARSGADPSQWVNIADLITGVQYYYDGTPTTAAPGVPVKFAGSVNESALGLHGDVFIDAAGNYYINGAPITSVTPAQIQSAIAGQAVAIQQATVANKSSWLDSPLAPLAVFALPALVYGLPMLTATATGDAGAAAATASPDVTSSLVQALNAQQAEQTALEQAIAAADAAPSASTVLEAANQAQSAASALSDTATQTAAATSDAGVQAATAQASAAADTLSTTAANVAAAAPAATSATTAASLLNGLKMAASAAGAAATLISVATRKSAVAARPVTSLSPYYGSQSPYLTQGAGASTNQGMLLLAAGVAAVFLLRGKSK